MRKGLILGKFMPVHKGHLALIEFGLSKCEELVVLLCHHQNEEISGKQRMLWLKELFQNNSRIILQEYFYKEDELTSSSAASYENSKQWAKLIKKIAPDIDAIISSEKYGDYLAGFLKIAHVCFDTQRNTVPVSASAIRSSPLTFWDYIPSIVQPFFVKKIFILGSESTGKSTLTKKLAAHYKTSYVPEMARDVIGHTNECTFADLYRIAELQAKTILEKEAIADKLLFCDTDLNITKSYSSFLFQKELIVENWIESANQGDLYLFLETDCDHIQDGTRLSEAERNQLSFFHKELLRNANINYKSITGSWEERFKLACHYINQFLSRF